MYDISTRRALAWPALLMILMLAVAAAISLRTGVDGSRVFRPYLGGWMASTFVAILIWSGVETVRMARRREEAPLRKLGAALHPRLPLLVIPALIFPMFIGGYTWAKCSIPFVVGYPWEGFWANADHVILRTDAWRIAHAVMPPTLAPVWTFFYAIVWGFALVFVGALFTLFAGRRLVATFYTTLMLSWFLGGFILAYAISAAGPVFAHLAHPDMIDRFLPLRATLRSLLGPDDIVVQSQRYLASGMNLRIAVKGAGVSAMPSMHIATCTTMVLAARGTRWMWPALLFWGLTFFGSVYLGYHYAIDAPVAVAVAIPCWMLARKLNHKMMPDFGLA